MRIAGSGVGCRGVPELIVHDRTGLLVPAGDLDALGSAIAGMVASPSLRHEMGERALGRAMQYYDARECARRHATLYRELVPITRLRPHRDPVSP